MCVYVPGNRPADASVFQLLLSVTGLSGILTWISISVIHIRFRAAFKAQGRCPREELSYMAPFFPVSPWLGLSLGLVIVAMLGYAALVPFRWQASATAYIGTLLFFGLYIFYKKRYNTTWVDPALADLHTGVSTD